VKNNDPVMFSTAAIKNAPGATEMLKRYKSPDSDKIPEELIHAGGNILRSEINKLLIIFGRGKNFQSTGRNLLM
jgi:hypothetical protein